MTNIIDYVKWRGDLSFQNDPFNDIDALALSLLVYVEFNNVVILYNKEFIEINYKRVKLELKAEELYPEGYDLNQLFLSYKERKLERDIERGSKKALKKIRKDHLK